MAIQFINTNPAIDQFNARVQQGDQARRLEEQDFRQRFQLEHQLGADKARRAGAEAYFATPPTATPIATPPTPAAPAIASYTAQPQAAPLPAQNPADAGIGLESEAEVSARMRPSAASRAQQSASQPPAIASVRARPTASAEQGARFSRMASTMAKTPGTGADLLHMVTADVTSRRGAAAEERKLHMEGLKLMSEAMKEGNLSLMRLIDQKYELFPPGALNSKEVAASIASGNNVALMRRLSPEAAVVFGVGYTDAKAGGADENTAMNAGMKEAAKMEKTIKGGPPHYYTDDKNRVQAVGRDLVARPVQGPPARPPQPPFALTAAGVEQRDQQLWDKSGDNVRQRLGRMASPLVTSDPEFRRLQQIEYESMKKRGIGGTAAPAAPAHQPAPTGERPPLDQFFR